MVIFSFLPGTYSIRHDILILSPVSYKFCCQGDLDFNIIDTSFYRKPQLVKCHMGNKSAVDQNSKERKRKPQVTNTL